MRCANGTGGSNCMEWKMRMKGKAELRADKKDMRRKRKSGSKDHVKEGNGDHFQSGKCHRILGCEYMTHRDSL